MNNDPNPDIWRLQAQFDIQGLIRALESDHAGIRKRAAAALRAMDVKGAVKPLRAAFDREEDPDVRATIAAALEALIGDADEEIEAANQPSISQTLVNRLLRQLHSKNPEHIIDAAQQLGDLGDKLAVEPLVVLFNDAKVLIEVRLAVAEALLKLESAPVEVTLLATLRRDNWQTRRTAAAILGKLRAEWAVEPLAQALRDPHPVVRRTARAALKYIGTPEARRALAQHTTPPPVEMPIKDSSHEDPTIPVAPRHGLLRHVKHNDDTKPKTDGLDASKIQTKPLRELNLSELPPTQPLNPDALEEWERRHKPPSDS